MANEHRLYGGRPYQNDGAQTGAYGSRAGASQVHTEWADYYKNIVDVIDNGAELIVKPQQVLRVMKVIDAMFESEKTRRSISCRI